MTDADLPPQLMPTDAGERDYFLKRADDHRRLAAKSAEPGARSLHTHFEELYLARARGDLDGSFGPDAPAEIPGTGDPIDG